MKQNDAYTSTGKKLYFHEEKMRLLRDGTGRPITAHAMITDRCQASCGFCSVHHREGNTLDFDDITGFFDILLRYQLNSAIISGGGNPILYKCKRTGKTFNDVIDALHERGLQIGLITNGLEMKVYPDGRNSWLTVRPETLDKLMWIRVSLAGLDHEERKCFIPDIDQTKTTLGFSYVGHDLFFEPLDKYHGKVSTQADLISIGNVREKIIQDAWKFEDRIPDLTQQIGEYARIHKPTYIRFLPNCLEINRISDRCEKLQTMADAINRSIGIEGYSPAFVQYKPPQAPPACYLGYVHPVLNSDGFVLPCDSCCLNESADHKLGEAWRICHWKDIASIYEQPVRSLIKDPKKMCPGCVFTAQNVILGGVVDGSADLTPPGELPTHANFV